MNGIVLKQPFQTAYQAFLQNTELDLGSKARNYMVARD